MNNVSLIGNIVRDPELRVAASGISILKFTVAVRRRFKDKATGEYQADFINCLAFKNTADFIAQYFEKGDKIALVGSIQTGSYEKDDGTRVYTTEVLIDQAEFCQSNSGQRAERPKASNQYTPSEMQSDDDYSLPFEL